MFRSRNGAPETVPQPLLDLLSSLWLHFYGSQMVATWLRADLLDLQAYKFSKENVSSLSMLMLMVCPDLDTSPALNQLQCLERRDAQIGQTEVTRLLTLGPTQAARME